MDFFCSLACLLIFIIMFPHCESEQSQVDCLRSIKESLQDPFNKLSTWQFYNNNNIGFGNDYIICLFDGVQCSYKYYEYTISSINLAGMGLIGEFPHGILNCSSLVNLDLSNNHLHGSIPLHLSKTLTYLDLSSNNFSGEIPVGIIADCPNIEVLKLNNNFLTGPIPQQLATLQRLITFTVANNHLHGSIPLHLSKTLTYLDLSSNNFSGEIPVGIVADCQYLKVLKLNNNFLTGPIPQGIAGCPNIEVLKLNNNFLTGPIPQQLATLQRLMTFIVANNLLSGPVPSFFPNSPFSAENYAKNTRLCGYPLDPCDSERKKERDSFISGLVVGWTISFALFFVVGYWFIPLDRFIIKFIRRRGIDKYFAFKFVRREGITNPRLQLLPSTSTNRIYNSMILELEKFTTRMSFSELSEATDNFSENNIIAIGDTGITYKGTIRKCCCVAIRNLFNSPNLQREFQSEITLLAKFRHKYLVPLIGFCHEFNGSFIIYKFMANGSLHDCLFSAKIMEWAVRVRIAIGVAKGIAWLHQNGVVHRGISSKCVLLDENFDPNISDFGKATTPGCYDEDVYGFGIVLLELITWKRHDQEYMNSFESTDSGDLFEKISELKATGSYDDEMCRMLGIAQKCVECDPGNWPSMEEVYQMLIGKTTDDRETKNKKQFANAHRISMLGICLPCQGKS